MSKKIFLKVMVAVFVSFYSAAHAKESSQSSMSCDEWLGKYRGYIGEGENFLGGDEKVYLSIAAGEIHFEIGGGGSGYLGAWGEKFRCKNNTLKSNLEHGRDGRGKITLIKKNGKFFLRIHDFTSSSGLNRLGHLPMEDLYIPMKKARTFE